jgi:hypothetical protein
MVMHGAAAPSNTSQADVPTVTFVVSLAQTLVLWVLLVENMVKLCVVVTVLLVLLELLHLLVYGIVHKHQKLGVHAAVMLTGQQVAEQVALVRIAVTLQNVVPAEPVKAVLD